MFKNSATTAPAPLEVLSYHLNTAIEDYDVNFVSAIPSQLASNGVFLVPCIVSTPNSPCRLPLIPSLLPAIGARGIPLQSTTNP